MDLSKLWNARTGKRCGGEKDEEDRAAAGVVGPMPRTLGTFGAGAGAAAGAEDSDEDVQIGRDEDMQILVYFSKTCILTVQPSNTIDNVKGKIQRKEGTPPHNQCLTFEGKALQGGRTLHSYGNQQDSILNLAIAGEMDVAPVQSERGRRGPLPLRPCP